MSLPTENDISKALTYLAETDEPYAKAIGRIKGLEHQIKTIKAIGFLEAQGTVGERTAKSESSSQYIAFTRDYEEAVYEKETMAAKRKRAELTVDVWRSLNASRRQGQ